MEPRDQFRTAKASAPHSPSSGRPTFLRLAPSRKNESERRPHMQVGIQRHEECDVERKKELGCTSELSGLSRRAAAEGILSPCPTRRAARAHRHARFRGRKSLTQFSPGTDALGQYHGKSATSAFVASPPPPPAMWALRLKTSTWDM